MVHDHEQPRLLDLSRCEHLTDDELPLILSHFPLLESLELSGDRLPSVRIGECCPRLTHLTLSGDPHSLMLTSCPSLTSLKLRDIVSDMQDILDDCPPLRALELEDAWNPTDDLLVHLSWHSPALTSFTVSSYGRHITGQGLLALSRLRRLDVPDCKLTEEGLRMLADRSPHLQSLALNCFHLSSHVHFGDLFPHLEQLAVSQISIDDLALPTGLLTLELHQTDLNDKNFSRLLGQCPRLTRFQALDAQDLKNILRASDTDLPLSLTHLDLGAAFELTDVGPLPRLTFLKLSECPLLTEESVKALTRSCPQLKTLHLGGTGRGTRCLQITESSIVDLALSCHELEVLGLSYVQFLSDLAVCSLLQRCRRLRTLLICFAPLLTDVTLQCIAEDGENLEVFLASDCNGLTAEGLSYLSRACPLIEISTDKYEWLGFQGFDF